MAEQIKANRIKVGDLMTFQYWGKVTRTGRAGAELEITNVDNGDEFAVRGTDLIENAMSADQYASTKKVSPTVLADTLVAIPLRVPFTVVFVEKDGTERKLRGRRLGSTTLGRSQVHDLDLSHDDNRIRQVDHRTIQSLIVDNVRYVRK